MSKQLQITITVNNAEHGFETWEQVEEAMFQVLSWIRSGRAKSKVFGVYSEDDKRVGRIKAEYLEVTK